MHKKESKITRSDALKSIHKKESKIAQSEIHEIAIPSFRFMNNCVEANLIMSFRLKINIFGGVTN